MIFPFLDVDVPRHSSNGVYKIVYLNLFALPENIRMVVTSIVLQILNCQTP